MHLSLFSRVRGPTDAVAIDRQRPGKAVTKIHSATPLCLPYFHTRTRSGSNTPPMLCMAPWQRRRPGRRRPGRRVCRMPPQTRTRTPCSSPRTCLRRRWMATAGRQVEDLQQQPTQSAVRWMCSDGCVASARRALLRGPVCAGAGWRQAGRWLEGSSRPHAHHMQSRHPGDALKCLLLLLLLLLLLQLDTPPTCPCSAWHHGRGAALAAGIDLRRSALSAGGWKIFRSNCSPKRVCICGIHCRHGAELRLSLAPGASITRWMHSRSFI
jgi:hypothetical protein